MARLKRGVELCRAADDNGSRALLRKILRDEEVPNYLARQVE